MLNCFGCIVIAGISGSNNGGPLGDVFSAESISGWGQGYVLLLIHWLRTKGNQCLQTLKTEM